MTVAYHDPRDGGPLVERSDAFVAKDGRTYPIINDIPRFCEIENYTASFGEQWNMFDRTQLDGIGIDGEVSAERFFTASGWSPEELRGLDVLEVGSGAGRFSRVLLSHTQARLHSVDYSTAVEANAKNNGAIAPERFRLSQASIYELPFPDGSFDRTFCFGVLQHTPDFAASVAALVRKTKKGGKIAVDFYPIRGWWTKVHAKYLLRPLTKRMKRERLLGLIERNVDWMTRLFDTMDRHGLYRATRFLPIVDLKLFPRNMKAAQRREMAVLDTFDMFSPEYDNPQRLRDVARMFELNGARVDLAEFIPIGEAKGAVVRATRL
jgi:SAM-dependent methyltransferase